MEMLTLMSDFWKILSINNKIYERNIGIKSSELGLLNPKDNIF